MKGKVGLVLGFGIGYVLGTRAGRKRYEQIKKTAGTVWNSGPVQTVAGKVSGAVADRVGQAQTYVMGKAQAVVHAATAPKHPEDIAVQQKSVAADGAGAESADEAGTSR